MMGENNFGIATFDAEHLDNYDEDMKTASIDEIRKALRRVVEETGMSVEDYAKEKGMTPSQARNLRRIIDGTTENPGIETIREMLDVAGYSIFFSRKD